MNKTTGGRANSPPPLGCGAPEAAWLTARSRGKGGEKRAKLRLEWGQCC